MSNSPCQLNLDDSMTLELELTNIDPRTVDELSALIAEIVRDGAPGANVDRGTAIHNLVIRPAAVLAAWQQSLVDEIDSKWSWRHIVESEQASPEIVDMLLANFNASRFTGAYATGQIEIVTTRPIQTVISTGAMFTAGVQFVPTQSFRAVLDEDHVIDSADRVIRRRPDGNYGFVIDVVAAEMGQAGNLPSGTRFSLAPSPTSFVTAIARGDMVGGSEAQAISDVIQRGLDGMSAKVLSGRVNAEAMLHTEFPGSDVAIIGMGDAEMLRDRRSIAGVPMGGRVDVYLRTQRHLETHVVTANAEAGEGSHRSIHLGREHVAGAYRVISVMPSGSDDACHNMHQTWNVDLSQIGTRERTPDVMTAEEAAFSSYQSVDISFEDYSGGQAFDVYLLRMPSIGQAQQIASNAVTREEMSDWLIKAPMPIIVHVGARIICPPKMSHASIDLAKVNTAAVGAINQVSFSSALNASLIVNAIQSALPAGAYVASPIEMVAEVIGPTRSFVPQTAIVEGVEVTAPGGASGYIRSSTELRVPDGYSSMLTSRTSAFFASQESINISIETAN
ncbi:MAG: baseplate J/gp47 family protein [Candidatus Methanomethylophilaceae archaeon]